MVVRSEIQGHITESAVAQAKAEVLYQISCDLNAARDQEKLLLVLSQLARDDGAFKVTLMYVDLDEAGEPEWLKVVAHWERGGRPTVTVGTRYYLPEFHLASFWLKSIDEPQFVGDVTADKRIDEKARGTYAQMGIRSAVIIPLAQDEKWVGLLTFCWDDAREWSEWEVDIYRVLVGMAAPAVAARRLTDEVRTRAEELAVLNELGQILAVHRTVEQVVDGAYQGASRLLDTTNFYIALYDPEKDTFTLAISVSDLEGQEPLDALAAGEGFSGYVIRERTPLLIKADPVERAKELGIEAVETSALSWLGVPLVVGDQVMGVMVVQSYTTPRAYGRRQQDLLITIANQLAIALQNVRLFEQSQRRVREMQLLHSVSIAAASGGVRLEDTLQSTAEALADEYGKVHVGIGMIDRMTNRLHRKANAGPLSVGKFPEEGIPIGEGVIGWVVQNAEPALIPDVHVDSRCVGVLAETRSELCVPLIADGEVIGVINVESHQVDAFTEDDMRLLIALADSLAVLMERSRLFDNMESMVEQRTAALRESVEDRERLQEEIIEAQKMALQELSTPVIPIMNVPGGSIIAMPLVGNIDTMRARDITRALLAGIQKHEANVVIVDITAVPVVDSGVASYLNKTIQAARLKGARTIITGISEAVAETIVDLGIDWDELETLPDMQTGLLVALQGLGLQLTKRASKR